MYDEAAMMGLDDETREKVEAEKEAFDNLSDSINAVNQELSGGKIQKAIRGLEKQTRHLSDAFKDGKNMSQTFMEAFEDVGLGPLESPVKHLASSFG
jgi:phage-related protein